MMRYPVPEMTFQTVLGRIYNLHMMWAPYGCHIISAPIKSVQNLKEGSSSYLLNAQQKSQPTGLLSQASVPKERAALGRSLSHPSAVSTSYRITEISRGEI